MKNKVKYLLVTLALMFSLTIIVSATSNLPVEAQDIVTGEVSIDNDDDDDERGNRNRQAFDRDQSRSRRGRR
ncbi:MAG: hypothetical protein AAF629_10035 [Chloroflexota bacterium]